MVGPPSVAQIKILQLLQVCTNHRLKRVQRQTYLFWRLLADKLLEPPEDKADDLRKREEKKAHVERYKAFIANTMQRALVALMYPPEYGDMADDGDAEAIQDFRVLTKVISVGFVVVVAAVWPTALD